MITDGQSITTIIFGLLPLIFKVGFIAFSVLYFIFSLIVIRQVSIMAQEVMTEGNAILKALSLVHAGLALVVIIFFIVT